MLDDVEKLLHFCNFLAILKNNKLEFILANIFLYQLPTYMLTTPNFLDRDQFRSFNPNLELVQFRSPFQK